MFNHSFENNLHRWKDNHSWEVLRESAIQEAIQRKESFKSYDELYRFFAAKRHESAVVLKQVTHRIIVNEQGKKEVLEECPFGIMRENNEFKQTPVMKVSYPHTFPFFLSQLDKSSINENYLSVPAVKKYIEGYEKAASVHVYSSCEESRTYIVKITFNESSGRENEIDLMLFHPPGVTYQETLPLVENYYAQLQKLNPLTDSEAFARNFAYILWHSFDNMPTERGSAAIGEMIGDYLLRLHNVDVKYTGHIPLDLRAIFSSKEEFAGYCVKIFTETFQDKLVDEKRSTFKK